VAEKKCSGHAATSIGLLTYLLLELFVYHPNLVCGLTCQRRRMRGRGGGRGTGGGTADYTFEWGYGWHAPPRSASGGGGGDGDADPAAAGSGGGASAPPPDSVAVRIYGDDGMVSGTGGDDDDDGVDNNNATTTRRPSSFLVGGGGGSSRWEHHMYALLYAFLFLPVPFSRVYLHDHTRDQVLAGSAVGAAISAAWYAVVVRWCGCTGYLKRWGRSRCGRWWGLRFGTAAANVAGA
jgi:hypothetical protein